MATDGRGTGRRTWRQRSSRLMQRLFCSSCVRRAERMSSPTMHRTQGGEEDWQSVRITVDDLGTVNPSFVPPEDGGPSRVRRPVGRSSSLVWACHWAWQKRKLAPLSSLPLQSCQSGPNRDALLFGFGEGVSSTLLTPPLINLIPPTPSDVIDDDQFFDINSEEDSVAHTSGSECVDSVSSQALGDQDSVSSQALGDPDSVSSQALGDQDSVSSQALGDQDSASDQGQKPWDSPRHQGQKPWDSPRDQGHKARDSPSEERKAWDSGSEQEYHSEGPARDREEESMRGSPLAITAEDDSASEDSFPSNPDQTKEQAHEPANEETNEPANEETNEPANEETNEPANEETKRPANEETKGPANEEVNEPANEETNGPANEEANEPANEETKGPANEEAKGPANEETKGPANEEANEPANEETKGPANEEAKGPAKYDFLRSSFHVPALPEYPRMRSINAGINLLQFTEHNLDELNNKDVRNHQLLKAKLRLLPLDAKMQPRKPATRTCSLGDHVTRSHTYHCVSKWSEETPEEEGSPRQRRITVASYIPHTKDRNGKVAGKQHSGGDHARPLAELNTEEVCRWFVSIGLQKCIPFIRGAGLCGSHIASIDPNILEVIHVSALEERELLLSAIYRELHPPDSTTQKLDTLLESTGPQDVDKFTAALVSMSKSRSSPHVNCVTSTRSSFKFRDKNRRSAVQRSSHLVEITINALEQIVHLRTPRDTSVGKVMDSCLKTLGVTDSRELFSLTNKGPLTELAFDQQIGNLLGTEKRMLELHLCKKEKQDILYPKSNVPQGAPFHNLQGNLQTKEERIRELNQHVDSLQNVIHQVQELHQSLVAFCGELRSMESEPALKGLTPGDLEAQLGLVQRRVLEKQQSVQAMQDRLSSLETSKSRCPEVHLLDKMKLDCQIFKEEISIIHLNRQAARLKSALQEFHAKEHSQRKSSSLGQLVSPQCPAVLLMAHEEQNEGRYGFTARCTEAGLEVVSVEDSQLCLHDRLVEVNGVSVLDSGEDELSDLLSCHPSARIVVLRKPPPLPPKPGRVPEPGPARPRGAPPPRCQVIAT